MKVIVEEVNEKLKVIVDELKTKQLESNEALDEVQKSIDEKIDEAKKYKADVDHSKEMIKSLENDIESLEKDLADLTEKFGSKDLTAIVEAGNKEINSKIMAKQKEIAKYRDKIAELTERARSIKELLINLKKDKELKEERLLNFSDALTYYEKELNEIIEYSTQNYETLGDVVTEEEEYVPTEYVPYEKEEVIDSPVFDEIVSMDDDKEEEKEDEETTEVVVDAPKDAEGKIDFQALNDSIDEEYASIFGNNVDISLDDINEEHEEVEEVKPVTEEEPKEEVEPVIEEVKEEEKTNIFDEEPEFVLEPDTPTNEIEEETPTKEEEEVHSGLTETDIFGTNYKNDDVTDDEELVNFFSKYDIDFYGFKQNNQNYLKGIYNTEMFTKLIDVLKRNNIDIANIYDAANVFGESTPAELEHVISKLLLAGQTTDNIGYVLNALPLISSFDLNEVIESYGPDIKNADITDLVIKAKHLSEMSGGVN